LQEDSGLSFQALEQLEALTNDWIGSMQTHVLPEGSNQSNWELWACLSVKMFETLHLHCAELW
jgi:hypothetical protein